MGIWVDVGWVLGEYVLGVGGFKIAVLRSKMNSLNGNSSNFENSLLANCVGLHKWLGAAHKGEEGAACLQIAQNFIAETGSGERRM